MTSLPSGSNVRTCRLIYNQTRDPLYCIAGQKVYSEAGYNASVGAYEAIVNQQFFCVHDGLSPESQIIEGEFQHSPAHFCFVCAKDAEELAGCGRGLKRFCERGGSGMMCDIVWCDPVKNWKLGEPLFQTNRNRVISTGAFRRIGLVSVSNPAG